MKKVTFFIGMLTLVLIISCKDSKTKEHHQTRSLQKSTGSINSLSIVIDDSLWKGGIGETLRNELASPVTGLPQEEPLFSLSHIPPSAFSGFTRLSRIFIKIEPHNNPYFEIVRDTFAKPQTGVFIGANNTGSIKKLIKDNRHQIIQTLKRTEIQADQRRIAKSLKNSEILKKKFGLTLRFPTAYRYAVEKKDFVWIRKDIPHGSMEMLIYQVPMNVIDKDTNVVGNIIKMRDSIGKKYIPGHGKGSYMRTEKAYAPYLFKTKIDGKFTYLTKGTWEVKDEFMAGPFINYAVRDKKNNRYLILEGFVFKPQAPTKRNNIFELKAIFRSAKID